MCFVEILEKRFNMRMLTCVLNYITSAKNGLTALELIDLLSCNNEFFADFYMGSELPATLRFPIAYWLLIKLHLGPLLTHTFMDGKRTLAWSHDYIRRVMKQRYLNKVDHIRNCHKEMANLFLELYVDTKPLVDMKRNMQIRLAYYFFFYFSLLGLS